MARKPNHAWEKRQREIAKAAKKAAKLQRRQAAKDDRDGRDDRDDRDPGSMHDDDQRGAGEAPGASAADQPTD